MTILPIGVSPAPVVGVQRARPVSVPPDRMRLLEPEPTMSADAAQLDPGLPVLTCANCGAPMDARKCKLICRCGDFLSCSDYY